MAACGSYNPNGGGGGYNPGNGGGGGYNPGNGGGGGYNPGGKSECEDCLKIVKSTKKVTVPVVMNRKCQYTAKVPRVVTTKQPRQVTYNATETVTKQVPYTHNRTEQKFRIQSQTYKEPVQRKVTRMVTVTRKVPKTIYVDVTTTVPKEEVVTDYVNKTKMVKIPYTVNIPETRYKSVQQQVTVPKTKTVYDDVQKTVYEPQVRVKCEQYTKMVTKDVPVYTVYARNPAPCPPTGPCNGTPAPLPSPVPGPMPSPMPAPMPTPLPAPVNPNYGGGETTRLNKMMVPITEEADKNHDGTIDAGEFAQQAKYNSVPYPGGNGGGGGYNPGNGGGSGYNPGNGGSWNGGGSGYNPGTGGGGGGYGGVDAVPMPAPAPSKGKTMVPITEEADLNKDGMIDVGEFQRQAKYNSVPYSGGDARLSKRLKKHIAPVSPVGPAPVGKMMVPITEEADLNKDGMIDISEFAQQAKNNSVPYPGGH